MEVITCNDTYYKTLFPPRKCQHSWFEVKKVVVYNQECDGVWKMPVYYERGNLF